MADVQPAPIPDMVYISAGSFLSGEHNTPAALPAFYIDQTEVSNADFSEYCKTAGCPAPSGAPDLPVVRVTIAQAREYAASKGKRLPTALEWERAARGTEGAKYPWGDNEDKSLANVAGTALKPVKSYTAYRDIYQMAGNAWEMVEGTIKPSERSVASFAKLLKPAPTSTKHGSRFAEDRSTRPWRAVGYEFRPIPERYSSSDIGFRCAKSAP